MTASSCWDPIYLKIYVWAGKQPMAYNTTQRRATSTSLWCLLYQRPPQLEGMVITVVSLQLSRQKQILPEQQCFCSSCCCFCCFSCCWRICSVVSVTLAAAATNVSAVRSVSPVALSLLFLSLAVAVAAGRQVREAVLLLLFSSYLFCVAPCCR